MIAEIENITIRENRMKLQSNQMNDAVFVEVAGRIDAAMSPTFEKHCEKWLDKGIKTMVLNFEGVEYLSSAGLRSVLMISKKLGAQNGQVVFCGVKGTVKEIFDISGFASLFTFYKNPKEVLENLG